MKNKTKSVQISEQLHKRLKMYCASENLNIGYYAEYCINTLLSADQIESNLEYKELENQILSLIDPTEEFNRVKFNELVERKKILIQEIINGNI